MSFNAILICLSDGSQLTSQAPPCRMKFSQLLDLIGQIAGFLYAEVFCSNDKVRIDIGTSPSAM